MTAPALPDFLSRGVTPTQMLYARGWARTPSKPHDCPACGRICECSNGAVGICTHPCSSFAAAEAEPGIFSGELLLCDPEGE